MRLREHLQMPEVETDFQNFIAVENEVTKEASETLRDIERDITATKALMSRIKEQTRSGKLTKPDLIEEANNSYTVAKEELQRLEHRQKETTKIAGEDEERRNYKSLMKEVGDSWNEIVMPEEYPRLVYLFIKFVTLDIVSPTFFSVKIEWRDSSWGVDCGLCYKGSWASLLWTKEEVAILKKYYPTATRKELTELLPRRNYVAMKGYFSQRGIKIKRPIRKEEGIPFSVCLEDWKVMQQYDITEDKRRTWRSVVLVTWCCPQLLSIFYYRGAENHCSVYALERIHQPNLYNPMQGSQCRTSHDSFFSYCSYKQEIVQDFIDVRMILSHFDKNM